MSIGNGKTEQPFIGTSYSLDRVMNILLIIWRLDTFPLETWRIYRLMVKIGETLFDVCAGFQADKLVEKQNKPDAM